jgi:hypothetical protein
VLGGVKASTPTARSLLDPACAPGGHIRRSAAEERPFSLTKEYFREDTLGTFGEGTVR